MPVAVLQTTLERPSVEQLKRAFAHVPGLTPTDAHIIGRDAFGILVKDFSPQQAAALQGALRVENIETEVVDQSLLPQLPVSKFVRRLDCRPEHLLIYDPLGREFPLPWQHVMLVAAGRVKMVEFNQRREEQTKVRSWGDEPEVVMEVKYTTREERNFRFIAELIITGGSLAYNLRADQFDFAGLGDRRVRDAAQDLSVLIGDLAKFANHAVLNSGAEALLRHDSFDYPSKSAFQEEIIWRLWCMKQHA